MIGESRIYPTGPIQMKNVLPQLAIVLGCISISWANAPASSSTAPLTSVRAIRSLTNAEASRGLPVAFQATVTYFRDYRRNLFVQDANDGLFVSPTASASLVPGDRVLIKGTTASGYRTTVVSSDITVLGHDVSPKPVPATFDELVRGRFDSMLVTAHGVVQSADRDKPSADHLPGTTLRVLLDGGYVDAHVDNLDERALANLLDAEVEITGVAGGELDGKLQLTGIVLNVASPADIKTLKSANVSPWSLPLTPMDKVLSVYHVQNLTSRVRVSGTVTFFEPGSALVLESGDKSMWIKTESFGPMRVGDFAVATGFPAVSDGFLMLYGSAVQDSGIWTPVPPEPLDWQQLASSKHIFDLVSIEGQVVMEAREASQDEYVLASDGHMFSAVYPHAQTADALTPMREVPVGTRVRVTGICATDNANPLGHDVPFRILLRSPNDLEALSRPSWMTVRHLGLLVVLLLLAMLGLGSKAWYVDRTMRAHVAALGYLVQRRGIILEDINNSRPLTGILESITELASVSLKGAPCWCQIENGASLGNCPSDLSASGLRLAERAISAHSGPALGTIFAAFDARTAPDAEEERALSTAAELATLAIETSRLHSDLVHRSEFDMLTDIQNRFSFEKHLDRLIDEAGRTASIFGLIYIDLDDFKQVNDFYGHHIGDLYLQHVVARMKHQLRPGDLLARLGGDEFGVLVPVVNNHSDVEEIALRMERCFDEPFAVETHVLCGSATVGIALYPADAVTNDSLLSAADAAMYVAKYARKAKSKSPTGQPISELASKRSA
ncbi:MAG TPA: diguanylate cyclase [Terracidiphilus sp.]|nr:diguanylate cyclase [Terracidiphilus sp.]